MTTANPHRFVPKSHKEFAKDALEQLKRLRGESGGGGHVTEEQIASCSIIFDSIVEHLPVYGPTLAKIKGQYEQLIAVAKRGDQHRRTEAYNKLSRSTEVATLSHYQKRVKELQVKINSLKADNQRISASIENLRKSSETCKKEREKKVQLATPVKDRMTMEKRKRLRMSTRDAINLHQLHRELESAKMEVQETRDTVKLKYVPIAKKLNLKEELLVKEEKRRELASINRNLAIDFNKLKAKVEAAKAYGMSRRKCTTESHTITEYVLLAAATKADSDQIDELVEDDDPLKEKETEMIMDYIERFNENFEGGHYEAAALMAANSPKGILRTSESLQRFKAVSKKYSGDKMQQPLWLYCNALLNTVSAFRLPSTEDSIECATCALQQGQLTQLIHWIGNGNLTLSTHLGDLVADHCQCGDSSNCVCSSFGLAFTIYSTAGDQLKATYCLMKQGKMLSSLSYAAKMKLTTQDFARILYSHPSIKLAKLMIEPPVPHEPKLTLIMAVHILLRTGLKEQSLRLLEEYMSEQNQMLEHIVFSDTQTSTEVWKSLISCLEHHEEIDLAADVLSLITIKQIVHREAVALRLQWMPQTETHQRAVTPHPRSETPMSDSTISPSGTPFTRTNTASPESSTDSDGSYYSGSEVTSSVVS